MNMTRIAGVDIPRDKRVVVPFTYIYGIGNTTTKKILADAGVSEDVRVHELTNKQTGAIHAETDKLKIERDLRRGMDLNIKRLMEIGSYREVRHRRGLSARRRSTKSNARTHKGPAHTIAGKRE